MFFLWVILALSVTCESVAKKWQVWVGPLDHNYSILVLTIVCRQIVQWYRSRITPIRHTHLCL